MLQNAAASKASAPQAVTATKASAPTIGSPLSGNRASDRASKYCIMSSSSTLLRATGVVYTDI